MIKEKNLVPGRVLARREKRNCMITDRLTGVGYWEFVEVWMPCMVISYIPIINRRHGRSTAPREGWDVLVFWFEDKQTKLESVHVPSENTFQSRDWRIGW